MDAHAPPLDRLQRHFVERLVSVNRREFVLGDADRRSDRRARVNPGNDRFGRKFVVLVRRLSRAKRNADHRCLGRKFVVLVSRLSHADRGAGVEMVVIDVGERVFERRL